MFIVDPITGAKVWERYGFISAEGMVEELVPFLDAGKAGGGGVEVGGLRGWASLPPGCYGLQRLRCMLC